MSTSVDLSLRLPGVSFIEGATIDAAVRATAERDVTVEGGRVELVRTMTYRYTAWSPYASPFTVPARDSQVVSQAHFHPAGPLIGGRPFVGRVALDIPPDGPGSVQGELVDISWAVRARLHIPTARDAEATTPIVVLSQARDCAPVADAPPVLEDLGCAVLGFEHGPRLTDDPARNPVHEDKHADTVVASLPLADHVGLEVSRPLRFEFTLPVPPRLPAPSMRMPNFTLSWMLRGVVDRQLRRDPGVAVELQAVTTPR